MPCYDPTPDYYREEERSRKLQEERDASIKANAQLLVWLLQKIDPSVNNSLYKNTIKIIQEHNLTAANSSFIVKNLCETLGKLTKEQLDEYVYNARDKNSRKLADWYEDHKIEDRLREEKKKQILKDAMSEYTYDVVKLKSRYGKASDNECRHLLERITIMNLGHSGIGSMFGFYTIDERNLDKIKENPRCTPINFVVNSTYIDKKINLYRQIFVLSNNPYGSSTLYVSEIFDQMTQDDKIVTSHIKIEDGSMEIDGDEEFCIKRVTLYTEK